MLSVPPGKSGYGRGKITIERARKRTSVSNCGDGCEGGWLRGWGWGWGGVLVVLLALTDVSRRAWSLHYTASSVCSSAEGGKRVVHGGWLYRGEKNGNKKARLRSAASIQAVASKSGCWYNALEYYCIVTL